jgi:hypothetical protein
MGGEIIEQGARDSGLSDTAFVGTDEDDSWSGHGDYPAKRLETGVDSRL